MKRVVSIIATVAMTMSLFTGVAFANQGNGNGHGNENWQNNDEQKYDSDNQEKVKDQSKHQFKDMNNHWGKDAVDNMELLGILAGYADGTFQPDKAITQAELAVILDRVLGIVQNTDENTDDDATLEDNEDDSDVPSWAENAVSKGFHHNYLNQKRFHSNEQCDRLSATVAIAKALGLDPITDGTENPFGDSGLISDEDYGYVLAMYEEGYITGYPDGNFNPNFTISRAQIATIIYKLLLNADLLDGTLSEDATAPDWDNDSEITASAITGNSVKLAWSAADDDVAVTAYKVSYEVNDVEKTKVVSGRTALITGLESETEYTFTVEAKDAAGNLSNDGPSVDVTTLEADAEDATVPTWSSDKTITATAITVNSVTLKWSGATDDVAVVAYKISYKVNDVEKTKYVSGRTALITGLAADTTYTFNVEAKDAASNLSTNGPIVAVTTMKVAVLDTTAPTWASGAELTLNSTTSGSVTLSWPDAEDNVGIDAYKVYKDGQLIKILSDSINSIDLTGLTVDQEYTFKVRAADDAGNLGNSLMITYLAE